MRLPTSWLACAGPAAALASPVPAPAAPRPAPVAATPAETCLRQAREAAAAGDNERALAWLDHALAHDPNLSVAHLCRAMCLLHAGRENEARGALLAALHADPREPAARIALARIHLTQGESAEAMRLLGPALEAAPQLAQRLEDDASFATLRDDPRWWQMLGKA